MKEKADNKNQKEPVPTPGDAGTEFPNKRINEDGFSATS